MEKLDTGLLSLVKIAKMLGIPADANQMQRAYAVGEAGMDTVAVLRAAKDLELKASLQKPNRDSIAQLPFPAIALLTNGNYVVIIRSYGSSLIIDDPYRQQPFYIPMAQFQNAWSGEIILLVRRPTIKTAVREFGMNLFLPIIGKYRRILLKVLFMSFLLQLFGLISPLFMQVIIDRVLVHRSLATLDILVGGMLAISVFQAWLTALRAYLFTNTTNKIDASLSSLLFRHVTALPLSYYERWQVGDIVSRLREVEVIRNFLTGTALTVVLDILFAIVYIGVMITYSSTLSLTLLVVIPFFIILNVLLSPWFRRLINQRFQAATANQSYLIEAVTGIQTIKAMAVEGDFARRYEEGLVRYVKAAFSTTNLSNVAENIGVFAQQAFNLSILWIGARAVIDQKLTVGELIAFQMLAGQVIAPILRLVNTWQYFQQTRVSVDRLGDILQETPEPPFNPNRTTLPEIEGDIKLDRVTFRYHVGGSEILRQVSLHIKPGSRVGIVGRSGSGKSTLTKLIQRLYVPESGAVFIDGVDLGQVEPAWLRRQIGVVLQEDFLFNGTISENIAIARDTATEEEVRQVAVMSGADEFIAELPDGYNTKVGERGSLLSGGQRQRIAIARALLNNPKILIFDEATSALDYESERIIMDNLDIIGQGRTMLMIAHRLSTVRRSDMILVMDRGQVVEQGTHEELTARGGYYYHMVQQQQL
ncbi:MAG: apxIB 3 [Firmicutes bacterium]|nr:apxIB 3 [Bacillota bacterium]